ncbi:alpha/beta fold hydrolase [Paraburkholderia oxyphila]|uniref:alpha/beta fold hydrolase n=1 Tax=Paraburkholderia oxyphila TaxID=614212 RepID=UPI0004825203|nr:alpha/beta hydrolase [Paraburkholderia oxyphila]
MSSYKTGATAVLVHGAWADGSSWSKVIRPLEEAGLQVICAPVPLKSLREDTEAVAAVLEWVGGPVVLVGHAYAGAVIGAVNDECVKSLVFVAALAPDAGETVADMFYRDEKHPDSPELVPKSNGFIWMPATGFQNAFAQNATDEEKAISAAVQRPISVECIQAPVETPAWKTKPSWYLVAEEDRMINPATQTFMAERMGATVYRRRVDHTPSVTAPGDVVEVVLAAAAATLSA